MSLSLIAGPPNSGRATAILRRFADSAGRDPVLVVPTRDDVVSFERDLCAAPAGGSAALLGGVVTTFASLFGLVARATGAVTPPALTKIQRLQLIRHAAANARLGALAPSARSRGFAASIERLLAELQAAAIDPARLSEGPLERDLGTIYGGYRDLCAQLGAADEHDLAATATTALRASPDSWGGRPLFLYGFDDLTAEQRELLAALAAATEVTVTVTYEDRNALAARSRLLAQLRDELGGTVEAELAPDDDYSPSPVLRHLARHLFEPEAPRLQPDDGLELLEAAGTLAEVEQIGGIVSRLLADGVAADEIAIVLRQPQADGPLYDRVLSELGIPVATEASIPLARTGVGRSLAAALAACFETRAAADVVAVLRAPGGAGPESVDWLERAVFQKRLRSAEEAIAEWHERGRDGPWELEALLEEGTPSERLQRLGRIASSLGERPLRRSASIAAGPEALELRAAALARNAFERLAELGSAAPPLSDARALLDEIEVPLWTGPVEGRVRVLGPHQVRAARARHLFVAALQDGVFPAAGGEPSLLGDERREALGLPERRPPLEQERYLFHACVARPTECLHLSARPSDEDGRACVVSPFLDDVAELLSAGPRTRRRELDAVVFAPAEAPTAAELARSLTSIGPERAREWIEASAIPAGLTEPMLEAGLEARELGRALPGPLRLPEVVAALAERRRFGASTLEEYVGCSYRWFVRHELSPEGLRPRPDPLVQGGILHAVLQALYGEQPGGTALPRPDNVELWIERASALVLERAAERGLSAARGTGSRIAVARMTALLQSFLRRQALIESPLAPQPELLEASFGFDEDEGKPALELGDFELHGSIDRIDVGEPARAALIQDYKLGAKVTPAARLAEDGKLQIQLYALAARELWGLEPIGAVYHPLGARNARAARARGLLAKDERDGLLAGADYVGTDFIEPDEFAAALDAAAERAGEVVSAMRAGEVYRRPLGGKCPTWCTCQPICRKERAAELEPEEEEEA